MPQARSSGADVFGKEPLRASVRMVACPYGHVGHE
jgi:hypothetical protein